MDAEGTLNTRSHSSDDNVELCLEMRKISSII